MAFSALQGSFCVILSWCSMLSLSVVMFDLPCVDAAAKRASFMGQEKDETTEQAKSPGDAAPLFPVFVIALVACIIFPWSIVKLCNLNASHRSASSWSDKDKKAQTNKKTTPATSSSTTSNVVFVALWAIFIGLYVYVSHITHTGAKVFDPTSILELEPDASTRQIKKQYRTLSLSFHPDKCLDRNPDMTTGECEERFLQISNAYKALTDPVARENLKKYGHPDGQQPMDVGIALPNFIFEKGTMAPLVLAALMGFGVIIPGIIAICYLLSSRKYTTSNVNQETLYWYSHFIKPSMALSKMPETLVICKEVMEMPVPPIQEKPMEELAKLVRNHISDGKDKEKVKKFFGRKTPLVKAHMLLLAHMDRQVDEIPQELKKDYATFLGHCPSLIDELLKVSLMPKRPLSMGWLEPSINVIYLSQSIVQAVPISARKILANGKAAPSDISSILQLPGVDADAVKKISRVVKAKDASSLMNMLRSSSLESRVDLLAKGGVSTEDATESSLMLDTLPSVMCTVLCETPGESEVCPDDLMEIRVKCLLTRAGMMAKARDEVAKGGADASAMEEELLRKSRVKTKFDEEGDQIASLGDPVAALTPHYPNEKEEGWMLIVADPKMNAVIASTRVRLTNAEDLGYLATKLHMKRTENSSVATANEVLETSMGPHVNIATNPPKTVDAREAWLSVPGQETKLRMQAPRDGKHDFCIFLLSDTYIGCDVVQPFVMRVSKRPSADEQPGKLVKEIGFKGSNAGGDDANATATSSNADVPASQPAARNDDDDDDVSDVEEDGELIDGDEYDSDETGTSESDIDDEFEEPKPANSFTQ